MRRRDLMGMMAFGGLAASGPSARAQPRSIDFERHRRWTAVQQLVAAERFVAFPFPRQQQPGDGYAVTPELPTRYGRHDCYPGLGEPSKAPISRTATSP